MTINKNTNWNELTEDEKDKFRPLLKRYTTRDYWREVLGMSKEDDWGFELKLNSNINFSDSTLEPTLYRKKPVTIKAMKWTGDNFNAIKDWAGDNVDLRNDELIIKTLEDGKDGTVIHAATVGDFIIQGVKGEFYFCKPDIFDETYETV